VVRIHPAVPRIWAGVPGPLFPRNRSWEANGKRRVFQAAGMSRHQKHRTRNAFVALPLRLAGIVDRPPLLKRLNRIGTHPC
jgi:hypothetical protein